MKNKIVCALLCGMFCLSTVVTSVTTVQAAPTAGIVSALSTETGTVEKKGVSFRTGAAESTEADTESTHTAGVTTDLFSLESTGAGTSRRTDSKVSGVMQTLAANLTDAGAAAAASEAPAAEGNAQEEVKDAEAADTEAVDVIDGSMESAEETTDTETAAADDEFANIGIAVVTDFVNVRSEPSAESEAVGKLYANNALQVVGKNEDGTWLQIVSGDLQGYVSAEFVSVGDPELIKKASHRIATVHTETLFVRALPTQESEVVEMVPDQEQLTVIDEQYVDNWGWVGVSVEEGAGYVSMEFVDLSTEYTYGETKEHEEARLAREEEERRAAEAAAAAKNASSSKSSSQSSSSSSGGSSGGGSAYVATGGGNGGSVANYALQFVGNPYVYGGSSLTSGTDCSGFVMSVYANYGVGLPHSSSALRGVGYGVDPAAMQPGDIVCYSGHVGIAIGGGQIVHASTPATGIKVSSAYYRDILAVRRIF